MATSNPGQEVKPAFDIGTADEELLAAGWARIGACLYQAPGGHIFRGPARAWHVMKGLPMPHDQVPK
jgi:hypothetical protein